MQAVQNVDCNKMSILTSVCFCFCHDTVIIMYIELLGVREACTMFIVVLPELQKKKTFVSWL